MSRSRTWRSDAQRLGAPLVPYKPCRMLRRLQSCPASLDTVPRLQLVFQERFSSSKMLSPRETLQADEIFDSSDDLLDELRTSEQLLKKGRVTVSLSDTAESCQSINQAVQSAYAVLESSGGRLHLTAEILLTGITQELEKEYHVIPSGPQGRDFGDVHSGDIVLLPAFGTTTVEIEAVQRRGATVVTTVCPSITKDSASPGFTTVIHGSSMSTNSASSQSGNYIHVRNLEEAHYLANYILFDGSEIDFRMRFKGATSDGFNPETMLDAIAFTCKERCVRAKKETGEIEDVLRAAMIEKYGIDRMDDHFMASNGGFRAEVDDSIMDEISKHTYQRLDMIIVVGSFNSKRARRLQHIARISRVPTYWIDSAACINVERNAITWQDARHRVGSTFGFLPQGETLVGVMSDPEVNDHMVEQVLERVYKIQSVDF